MELVYLWVENYKNIHEQEFNFSPKFNCHYDGETLTIKENIDEDGNKQYIENFFGDNINVTAIVGKNGSGKSSIVELLEHIDNYSCELYLTKRMPFLILFDINGKKKGFTNIENLAKINSLFEFVANPHDRPPTHQSILSTQPSTKYECTFSNLASFITLNSEMPYPCNDDRKLRILRKKTIDYSQSNIANLAIRNAKNNFTFQLTTFMLYPKVIKVFSEQSLISQYIDKIFETKFMERNIESLYKIQEYLVESSIQGNNYKVNSPLEAYMAYEIIKENKASELLQSYEKKIQSDIQEIYNSIESNRGYSLDEFDNLINEHYELNSLTKDEKKLLKKYTDFLNFDFEDIKGRSFSNLSHGEKSIYAQFISIYDMIQKSNNNLIVLDEPGLSLHPYWQKQYLKEIIDFIKQIKTNSHIILTTHSPFLLSDIPKENIIFLDTYKKDEDDNQKEGNCKVVDGLKEKKQTFGANIHTLLTDSFFMEGGLMGEFAKNKINKIIRFLNGKNRFIDFPIEQMEKVINSIGEPFLKQKLLDMYNKKFIKEYKDRQKEKIKKQIEDLNSQLKELNNDSNK